MLGSVDVVRRRPRGGQLPGQSIAGVFDERRPGGAAEVPKAGVGDTLNLLFQRIRRPQPAILSTGLRPQIIGWGRVPIRHVDAVGDVSDRDLVLGPVRKERLEDVPAHLPVQAAHAIDRPAPAKGQIGHVEAFGRVVRVLAAEGQQTLDRDPELLLCVTTEVLLDEGGRETVEARGHGRVGREEVPGSRDGQGDFERLPALRHEGPSALENREARMPFVQMADLRVESQRGEAAASRRSRAAAPAETKLGATAIELAGDSSMPGEVRGVIAVQEIELRSSDPHLPGTQPDRIARQGHFQPQPFAVRLTHGRDRQLPRVVVRKEGLLGSVLVDDLTKVALLVEQSNAHHRYAKITVGLELVAGNITETA